MAFAFICEISLSHSVFGLYHSTRIELLETHGHTMRFFDTLSHAATAGPLWPITNVSISAPVFVARVCHAVAVMGHVGLTPQAISVIGGFRAQGRTAIRARALLDEALRLQDSGCFAIVLECVPANVAEAITDTLEIPTIGIGAGGQTSGQVLVFHDMLGMLSHPHHQQFVPKFCKKYAQVGHAIQEGLYEFVHDVESGKFPGQGYSPYVMSAGERDAFESLLERDAEERRRLHEEAAVKLSQADEYETLSLYGASDSSSNSQGDHSRSRDIDDGVSFQTPEGAGRQGNDDKR